MPDKLVVVQEDVRLLYLDQRLKSAIFGLLPRHKVTLSFLSLIHLNEH